MKRFGILATFLIGAFSFAAFAADESSSVQWLESARGAGDAWVVVRGVTAEGATVYIASVSDIRPDGFAATTVYVRGGTSLVVQRKANDDGTFAVSYSSQGTICSFRGGPSATLVSWELSDGSLSGRLSGHNAMGTMADFRGSLLNGISGGSKDALAEATGVDSLVAAIRSYLADAEIAPVALPRTGDSIVSAGLKPEGADASIASGGVFIDSVDACADECAEGCPLQCAWECALSSFTCRVCMTACAIGCRIGCMPD